MKPGQKIFYVTAKYRFFDVGECTVYKIYKDGRIRVKVFNEEGVEANDFDAPRKDFCVTRNTAMKRLMKLSSDMQLNIKKDYEKMLSHHQECFEEARDIILGEDK